MRKSVLLIVLIMLFAAGMPGAETAGKKWREKGFSAMEIRYYNVAIACFEKAVALDPTDAESHFNMGICYNKEGKTKEATSCYKKAVAIDPEFAKAHYRLGAIYAEEGKLKKAISEFKKAIAVKPDYREAHCDLGVVYDEKGMLDEAISEYKKTLAMKYDIPMVNYNLGIVYYKKGLDALSADCLYKSGLLFLGEGDRDNALKAYEALKKTKSKELEKTLFERLHPDLRNKQGEQLR